MGDYERSTVVDVDRDRLFEYLSRIDNLPQYMDRLTEAHSLAGDRVSVEARIEPGDVGSDGTGSNGSNGSADGGTPERTVHGEAVFRIDADNRVLHWGSEGPHDYSGELQVTQEDGGSRVTVKLHTLHDDADGILSGIEDTLANIQRIATANPEVNPGTGTA